MFSYVTVREMMREWERASREYQKQRDRERNIVSSVPLTEIPVSTEEVPATEWWKPP